MLVIMPIINVFQMEGDFLASYEDIKSANSNKLFGSYITGQLVEQEQKVDSQSTSHGEIVFKLFGFIPIRKLQVVMADDDDYYIGGAPIGLSISTDGVIVISDEGDSCLREGDIITKINGNKIDDVDDIDGDHGTDGARGVDFRTLLDVLGQGAAERTIRDVHASIAQNQYTVSNVHIQALSTV